MLLQRLESLAFSLGKYLRGCVLLIVFDVNINLFAYLNAHSQPHRNGIKQFMNTSAGYLVRAKKPDVEEGGLMCGSAFLSSIQVVPSSS